MSKKTKYRPENESRKQKNIKKGNTLQNHHARNLDFRYLAFILKICF